MLFGKNNINRHIGVQDICNYLEDLASKRKSGCQLTIQATNTRRFHTLFFIIHHSATIVIYSSNYCVNGEFQRKTEKNREI